MTPNTRISPAVVGAAVMLLLVAVASPALAEGGDSTRVRVGPTSFTIEEGFKRVVTFELNQPIICEDANKECNVVILLTNSHPNQVRIDTCMVKWRWDEWSQTRFVTVSAHEDFIDDASGVYTIVTEPARSTSRYFAGQNAPDITLVTKSRPSGSCSGTGDPHYNTFDRFPYHVYAPGRTVFYKSTVRDFEVQTDMYSFHRPAVHCAVAAREGNNIVVVSLCADGFTPQYRRDCGDQECKNGGYPRVGITDGSNPRYVINFESGAQVTAQINFWSTIGKRYIDMYVTAPGFDYKHTEGMCGNFDGVADNDSPVAWNGWISDYAKLFDSQKPKTNLFDWYPSGGVTPLPTVPPHAEECAYIEPPFVRPLLNNPDIEDLTNTLKDTFDPDEVEAVGADFVLDAYGDGERLPDMSEEDATALCKISFDHAPVVKACLDVMPNFDVDEFLRQCISDAMIGGGAENLVENALEALREECADEGNRDQALWEVDENGNPLEPAKELQDAMCPGIETECSGHGVCRGTKCTCEAGYKGSDCSIDVNAKPVLEVIPSPLCASHGSKSCRLETQIMGRNFYDSPNIACKVGDQIMKAKHIGTLEVLCALPAYQQSHSGATARVEDITVTMDGVTWSNALQYTWYDATCQVCDPKTAECKPNPDSCTIDGKCYLGSQISKENPCHECDAGKNPTGWTYDYRNHLECGPRFDTPNVETRIGADSTTVKAGDVFLTLDAANPLVAADPAKGGAVTYTITDGDEHSFQIDPETGAISTSVDLATADLPYHFKNVFTVQATDVAGNTASVTVFVEVVEQNLSPLFPSAENTLAAVPENAPVGFAVGKVEAHDASKDTDFNTLKYTFITNVASAEQRFAVDLLTGTITVAQPLNYEMASEYRLQLLATDGGGQSHSTMVIIPVANVEEAPTDITLDGATIAEGQPQGTPVGVLAAVDEDADETFTFSVTSSSSPFTVDGDKLVTAIVLDFEELGASVEVLVMVTDKAGKQFSKTFTITVTNVNETPNQPTLDVTTISENALVGSVVASFTISDPDGDTVGCSLTADGDDTFEISSGKLILLKALDYETRTTYDITAVCVDDGVPAMRSDPATFTLTVTNANDAPEISAALDAVAEMAPKGTVVGTVTAVDHDADSKAFTIAVVAEDGKPAPPLTLQGTTCQKSKADGATKCTAQLVVSANTLDHEASGGVVVVVIQATDGTMADLVSRKAFKVTVTDVPETVTGVMWVGDVKTVAMNGGVLALRLPEGTPANTVVGQLQAVDDDEGQEYTMTLSQKGRRRRAVGPFSLEHAEGSSGVYNVILEDPSQLDRTANGGVLTIEVTVSTVGEANSAVATTAFVQVVEREQAITWPTQPVQFAVPEATAVGANLAIFRVEGAPAGTTWVTEVDAKNKDGLQTFAIIGGSSSKPKLSLLRAVDYEAEQAIVVAVTTTFTAADGTTAVVALTPFKATITDNDFAPVFTTPSNANTNVHPDSVVGQTVNVVKATNKEDKAVTFAIVAATGGDNNFMSSLAIDGATGVITVAKSLKNTKAAVYTVTVKASIAAGLSTTLDIAITVTSRSCDTAPCGDNGSCNPTVTSHTCTCLAGFTGDACATAVSAGAVGSGDGSTGKSAAALGAGGAAGIAIGVLLVVVLVALVGLLLVRRQRNISEDRFTAGAMAGKNVVENPTFAAPTSLYGYDAPTFGAGGQQPTYEALYEGGEEAQYEALDMRGVSAGGSSDAFSNPMYDLCPGVESPMYSWYKPNMTRQEATDELAPCGEGAFIVRDSKATPGWHMIGVKTNNTVVHEKIRQGENGDYELLPSDAPAAQPHFRTLPQLVGHYAQPQAGLPFTLVVDQPIYDNHQLVEKRSGSTVASLPRPTHQEGPKLPFKQGERDSMYGEC